MQVIQDKQTKLQRKVKQQIDYLSKLLRKTDSSILSTVNDIPSIRAKFAEQGYRNPSENDVATEQLKILKTVHEKILDDAVEAYRDVVTDRIYSYTKSKVIPDLKNKGIPAPKRIEGDDNDSKFSTLFKKARKTCNLNQKNSSLSNSAVSFGIFIVGRGGATTDTIKWELGSKIPQNNNLIRYACDFMNVDDKTKVKLITLREAQQPALSIGGR